MAVNGFNMKVIAVKRNIKNTNDENITKFYENKNVILALKGS